MSLRLPRRIVAHAVPLVLLAATGVGHLGAAPAPAAKQPAAAKSLPAPSTRHSPGWYPNVDPESASVLLGRRTNAPLVAMPFDGGTRSLEDLGRRVCRLLHHRNRDSLMALTVNEAEFRGIMWREFPQSRPATGLAWEDGWRALTMRLQSGISDAVGEYGGRQWRFVRFERPDSLMTFKNFRLHSGLVLVVMDEDGRTERWGWLRAVAERKGRFKIYSVRD